MDAKLTINDITVSENTLIMISCQISQNARYRVRSIPGVIKDMLFRYLRFSSNCD